MGLTTDPVQAASATRPLETAIEEAMDQIRAVAKQCDVAIAAVIVTPKQAKRCMVWPDWCGLDIDSEEVKGLKAPEGFVDMASAVVAMGNTSLLLLELLDQLKGVREHVESVLTRLGGSLGPWHEHVAQGDESGV